MGKIKEGREKGGKSNRVGRGVNGMVGKRIENSTRKNCDPEPKAARRDSALYESLLLRSYTDALGRPE